MNLLHFSVRDNQIKHLYFSNIDLESFLEIYPDTKSIVIISLFAHSSVKEYTEIDFLKNLPIGKLKKFKSENESVLINSIVFSIDSVQVDVNDENEYNIFASEPYFDTFKMKLSALNVFNDRIWRALQENAGKYILVDGGRIIAVFSTFDEFLESKYINMY